MGLSWNLLIPAGIALVTLYAITVLRGRSSSMLLGSYLSLILVEHWGRPLYAFLTGGRALFGFSLSLSVTPFTVYAALFAIMWIIFTTVVLVGAKMRLSILESGLYGFFAGCLVTVSLISFMTDADRAVFVGQSFMAVLLTRYRELLFLLPIALLLWSGLRPAPEERRRT